MVVIIGAPAFVQHVVTDDPGPELPPLYVISADPNELSWAPDGIGIHATPQLALRGLLAGYRQACRARPLPPSTTPHPDRPAATRPITAEYALSIMCEVVPEDAVVVEETPSHRAALHRYLPIRRPGGFLTGQSGVLGYALPAAIGVALAHPERPVLALLGDGSSLYSIQGVWTAVQQRANVTYVIFDNGHYATVRALADAAGHATIPGTEFGGTDFCGLARAWNCPAEDVTDPHALAPTLRTALNTPGPMLVRVQLDATYQPLYSDHGEQGSGQ